MDVLDATTTATQKQLTSKATPAAVTAAAVAAAARELGSVTIIPDLLAHTSHLSS